jgi:hypothetical protein
MAAGATRAITVIDNLPTLARPGSLGRSFSLAALSRASIYGSQKKCDNARRAVAGNHMPEYLVSLLDTEGHVTHRHSILAASHDAIIRQVASLYRSRPVVEIWAGDRVVARLTAEEMAEIDDRRGGPARFR